MGGTGDAAVGTGVQRSATELDTIDGEDPVASHAPAVAPASPALAVDYPELVGVDRRHYQIRREIAKGGMGRVLEARDLRLGRAVAIKELLPKNRNLAQRFEREARITARLQHPAIIHIYEAGTWAGGEPFYAMTYVTGRSLDKVIAERPTLAERLGLLPNVIAVADALAYAHNQHVVHRDLKPANVLVGAFGETVVIDWGLAKDLGAPLDPAESLQLRTRPAPDETDVGSVVGTPAYMPPEQATGQSVDQRADVYALGALLYHVLVGAPPFTGASSQEVLEQVKATAPVPVQVREPGAPADLVAIVAKAMARERRERYADADELAHDLKRFQTGQLVAARHYTTAQLLVRWVRRFKGPVTIAALALVALAVLGTVSLSRVLQAQAKDQRRRDVLLAERGRVDLLAGQAGRAIAYLVGAAHDDRADGAHRFMIADAIRSFDGELARFASAGPSTTVALSPDGAHVATRTARGAIQLWSITGARLRTLGEGLSPVTRVLFDPRGDQLIATHEDRVIRLFPLAGGPAHELVGHRAEILDADASAASGLLVTVDASGGAFAWDLRQRRRIATASCHGELRITRARFSRDGRSVASVGEDHQICRWDPLTGNPVNMLRGHSKPITSVRWTADGTHVLSASEDGHARLFDAFTGKDALAPLEHEGAGVRSAELSADGTRIVTAGADGATRVWALPGPGDEGATLIFKLPGTQAIEHAIFGDDDRLIATASHDGKARIWDAQTGQLLATFEHALGIHGLAFTRDGRLFTASDDGTARLWSGTHRTRRRSFELPSDVHALAVAPDGSLAAGALDTRIRLWPADATGLPPEEPGPQILHDHMGPVRALAFGGGRLASAGDDAVVYVWDRATGRPVHALGGHEGQVRALAISPGPPDAAVIATGDERGLVRRWSMATGRLLDLRLHDVAIASLAYAADGTLAGVDTHGQAFVWRATSPRVVPIAAGRDVQGLAFSPDGARLAIASAAEITVHAVEAGAVVPAPLLALDAPIGDVRAIAYAPDGARLVTAGHDGAIRIWDAEKGKLVGERRGVGRLDALAVTADTVWAAGDGELVQAWDIHVDARPLSALREFVEDHVPWRLDDDDVVRPTRERGE